jgi:hypothetical protein
VWTQSSPAVGGLLSLSLLAACAPTPYAPPATSTPIPELAQAERALTGYFAALANGRFVEAANVYAGPVASLRANNPDVNPDDHASLLERYCNQNGGVCLPVGRYTQHSAPAQDTFVFMVEFANPDGTTFEIGPCCGEEDTGQRTREFTYTVLLLDGEYQVFKLPPYVP